MASPHFFAFYTEMILKGIDNMDGFIISGTVVNYLRYAYDTGITCESGEYLQILINVVVTEGENGTLSEQANSFTMLSMSSVITKCDINVYSKVLGQVESFVNSESLFTSEARCEKEIRKRIGITVYFHIHKKVPTSSDIDIAVRLRVRKWYVPSTLLYGCVTWTISGARIIRDMALWKNSENLLERQVHIKRSTSSDQHKRSINGSSRPSEDVLLGTYS